MNVYRIDSDPKDAREKLRRYRQRKHADAEAVYGAAVKLLEAAADGFAIIDVGDAIAFGEFDDQRRPRLAIARADRKQVRVYKTWRNGPTLVFDCHATNQKGPHSESLVREVTREVLRDHATKSGYATVPMVPPEVRPASGQLRDWYILWEVDVWHDSPIVDPPYDPMLLEHIEGDFYKVLGEWDLTELERAAMQMAAIREPRQ